MSDSVGKISLDLELRSSLEKQINQITSTAGKQLNNSFSNITKNIFGNMTRQIDNLKNVASKAISGVMASVKNIKIPNPFKRGKDDQDNSTDVPKGNQMRGPPTGVNADVIKAQMDNLTKGLDITNAKIELQQDKLANLKETYINTFNTERKNKIQEDILKTEASINKLIGESDKAGFKLADLDKQFSNLGNSSKTASAGIDKTTNKITDSAKAATKTSGSLKTLEESSNRTGRSFGNMGNTIVSSFKRVLKQVLVVRVIYKVIKGLIDYLGGALQTNNQFVNSLKTIGTNLQVAFMPIYQFILPAINALMQGLSVVTTYIASFVSAIFGKTYAQSAKAAKGLNTTKAAMANVGKSAKKTAKEVKEAQGSLMGFDEINTLSKPDKGADDGAEGAGGLSVPPMVMPSMDTSVIDKSMSGITDKFKNWFKSIDFGPLVKSFGKLKDSISPVIENIGGVIRWFFDKILGPLAAWTISDVLPVFFDLLSGAIAVLNPLFEVLGGLVKWLWENFWIPIAEWTGGVAVAVLGALADVLTVIGDWISGHKTLIEDMVIVIASFAGAWALVNLAMKAWNIGIAIWNGIGPAATAITTAFSSAMAFLTSPITLVVLAIGAIIAIIVLLIKHWDWVKDVASKCWEGIKNVWNGVADWFNTKVLTPLGNFFSGLWRGVKNGMKDAVNFCIRGLNGLTSGILAPFNLVIKGMNLIPGVNIQPLSLAIPQIPKLARGGILDQPTLNVAGEAGKEAVIPLENNTQGLDLLADKLRERMGEGSADSNNNTNDRPVEITLELGGGQFAKFMIDSINNLQKKEGRVLLQI